MPPSPLLPTPRNTYIARINRVVDYISAHLVDTLDLATLADVAHFSPWHFHRVFQALTDETLADCVRRLRLEAAAQRLLATPAQPALHVAMEVGFASAEVFSRAFRAYFGVTPTAWRRGAWRDWTAHHQHELRKIHQAQRKANQDATHTLFKDKAIWPAGLVTPERTIAMQVELKTLPALRLAYMRNTGPYGPGIGQLWQRFGAWCGQHGMMNPRRKMYGISQDNPEITPADKCRYDACIEVDDAFKPQGEVGVQSFGGGRYACGRFTGKPGSDVHDAWTYMFAQWLPQSGYQADDKPALELYEENFVMDPDTGAFSCLLCVPVRAL
ncbi:AraC family transcriptional regulator [Polaromonas sp.]|uniref:AraC family transcriptional regulator n=1 Tax=Polaromonas sp. TaxID=1869339 RepID=UPI002FC7CFAD